MSLERIRMMEKSNYSDGGRKEFGFINEANDCTVRCVAFAYDISYSEAHAMLKTWGRKDGQGCYGFANFMNKQKFIQSDKIGYNTEFKKYRKSLGSLQKFLKDNPVGTFVVSIKGHALCVKNGVIFDSFTNNPRSQIKYWWRIK